MNEDDIERVEVRVEGVRSRTYYRRKRVRQAIAELRYAEFPGIIAPNGLFKKGKTGFEGDPVGMKLAMKAAERAGVSTSGKRFFHELAESHDDPNAWCSDDWEFAAKVRDKGWGCSGRINVEQPHVDVPDDTPYEPAPDIIEKRVVAEEIQRGAPFTPKQRAKFRQETKQRLSGDANLKPLDTLKTE